jgi:cold shock CspA family protein
MSKPVQYGYIRWFDINKGFGFIESGNNPDIFLHKGKLKDCRTMPRQGQKVKFVLERTKRGLQASSVILIDPSEVRAQQETNPVVVKRAERDKPILTLSHALMFGAGLVIGVLVTLALL